MKRNIYSHVFKISVVLFLMTTVFFSCEKEKPNVKSANNVRLDILHIYDNYNEMSDLALNKLNSNDIANELNPYDYVGQLHNEVLDFVFCETKNEFCDLLDKAVIYYNSSSEINCDNIMRLCSYGVVKSFNDKGEFNSIIFEELLKEKKISKNEYDLISTTISLSVKLEASERIKFIKEIEKYIVGSSVLTSCEKERNLMAFSIYRYSTFYWNENILVSSVWEPVITAVDAIARHWALT